MKYRAVNKDVFMFISVLYLPQLRTSTGLTRCSLLNHLSCHIDPILLPNAYCPRRKCFLLFLNIRGSLIRNHYCMMLYLFMDIDLNILSLNQRQYGNGNNIRVAICFFFYLEEKSSQRQFNCLFFSFVEWVDSRKYQQQIN